jgi:DNA-binding transcriptional MerR regulator
VGTNFDVHTLPSWGVLYWGVCVKKVEEYLEHASECRTLARAADPAHREQLEEMARTWEQLAEARRGKITKQLKAKYAHHPSAI